MPTAARARDRSAITWSLLRSPSPAVPAAGRQRGFPAFVADGESWADPLDDPDARRSASQFAGRLGSRFPVCGATISAVTSGLSGETRPGTYGESIWIRDTSSRVYAVGSSYPGTENMNFCSVSGTPLTRNCTLQTA